MRECVLVSSFQMYNIGLDSLRTWTTSTYRFLLMRTGTFDVDANTVADVIAGGTEVTAVGYVRQDAATKTRTVDDTLDRISYGCDDPDFGSLTAGQTVIAIVAYLFDTNDAGSTPIGWCDLPSTDTGAFDPFTVTLQDGVAFYADDGG